MQFMKSSKQQKDNSDTQSVARDNLKQKIKECWKLANSYDEFYGAMLGCDLILAQKTQQNRLAPVLNLVAVDREGSIHTISKNLEIPVKEIRKKFKDQDPLKLPRLEDIFYKLKNNFVNKAGIINS